MSYKATNLFAELTANGNTVAFELPGAANDVSVFLMEGAAYGAGTLHMESSFDGGTTWVDVPTASWTSGDGHLGTYAVHGSDIRFNLAGATAPSDMTVQVSATARNQWTVNAGTITANGSVDVLLGRKPAAATLFAVGTWGTGTLKLQFSVDGGTTWYDGASLTANGGGEFDNSDADATIWRINLAGATSPDLDWFVIAS